MQFKQHVLAMHSNATLFVSTTLVASFRCVPRITFTHPPFSVILIMAIEGVEWCCQNPARIFSHSHFGSTFVIVFVPFGPCQQFR